jgi:hypothetical protein
MTEPVFTAAAIERAITSRRFRYANEAELQRGLEQALTADGIEHEREVEIAPGCRVDFLAGGVAVEVKIDGGCNEVLRQLHRYVGSDLVKALLLVTSRERHGQIRSVGQMNGKPIRVVTLKGALL